MAGVTLVWHWGPLESGTSILIYTHNLTLQRILRMTSEVQCENENTLLHTFHSLFRVNDPNDPRDKCGLPLSRGKFNLGNCPNGPSQWQVGFRCICWEGCSKANSHDLTRERSENTMLTSNLVLGNWGVWNHIH